MKGDSIAYAQPVGDGAFIGLALDFYADPPGEEDGGFLVRDREYLEFRFLDLYRFGLENDVPMSVMEFGTIRDTFEEPDKGGAEWVADMLGIFDQYGTSYALWHYHGPSMGLYLSAFGSAPAEPNRVLIDVVRDHLATSSTAPTPAEAPSR